MPTTLQLIRKRAEGGNVWSFIFTAHTGASSPIGLSWTAGQFVYVQLDHPAVDAEGTRRYFTIASAPNEEVVQISTRITTSTFKQALASLPIGAYLTLLDPPAGTFVWQTSPQPLIWVAQGIGVTPFISMLRQRVHQSQPLAVELFYVNRTAPAPFQAELEQLQAIHPEFQLHQFDAPITASVLSQHLPQLASSLVYVSGPRPLIELLGPPYNLQPNQLKQDAFPNYPASTY